MFVTKNAQQTCLFFPLFPKRMGKKLTTRFSTSLIVGLIDNHTINILMKIFKLHIYSPCYHYI